jgi:hypothetical protein
MRTHHAEMKGNVAETFWTEEDMSEPPMLRYDNEDNCFQTDRIGKSVGHTH